MSALGGRKHRANSSTVRPALKRAPVASRMTAVTSCVLRRANSGTVKTMWPGATPSATLLLLVVVDVQHAATAHTQRTRLHSTVTAGDCRGSFTSAVWIRGRWLLLLLRQAFWRLTCSQDTRMAHKTHPQHQLVVILTAQLSITQCRGHTTTSKLSLTWYRAFYSAVQLSTMSCSQHAVNITDQHAKQCKTSCDHQQTPAGHVWHVMHSTCA